MNFCMRPKIHNKQQKLVFNAQMWTGSKQKQNWVSEGTEFEFVSWF